MERKVDMKDESKRYAESRRRPNRPFDPKTLRDAGRIVDGYRVILERNEENGLYYGRGIEYPYLLGHGRTPVAAYEMARNGLIAAVATDLERGERPPAPADQARSQQINLRVSATEKLQLEDPARRKGFRSVSDYVRTAALAG